METTSFLLDYKAGKNDIKVKNERFNKLVFSVKFQQRFFEQHLFLILSFLYLKKKKPLIVYFIHTPPIFP